jgi:hypothetical protein
LINDSLSREEMARVVRYALDVSYDEMVGGATDKVQATFKIIEYAERKQTLRKLIEEVIDQNSANENQLRQLLGKLEDSQGLSSRNGAISPPDPLARYFPKGQPFLDRTGLIAGLQNLWEGNQSGVLVVRGERYSGRSHSWWRILDAAGTAGIIIERLDLSCNPGACTVAEIVDRIARFLQVDREFLKDPLAQGSAQASALIAAMIDQFRRGVAPYERACIVFDGLDRPGVEGSIIELMEQMIGTVLQGSLAGLSLIILGYGPHSEQPFAHLIQTEDINPIGRQHVQAWLCDALTAAGKAIVQPEITAAIDAILDGFSAPYDRKKMSALRERAKEQFRALLMEQQRPRQEPAGGRV